MKKINSKHYKTLLKIFSTPTLPSIEWRNIEALFRSLGANIRNGDGSRVHIALNGEVATFHRPHPEKETDKGAVNSVRTFLSNAGINPESLSEAED